MIATDLPEDLPGFGIPKKSGSFDFVHDCIGWRPTVYTGPYGCSTVSRSAADAHRS
jgi:hypothetical protein